jgi:DAHP synthetase I family
MRISAPYKFISREFRNYHTLIRVGRIEIGGDEFVAMAGPCSVESEKQIRETAEAVAAAGARILRGGTFKPRTSPYDFQGLEEEGLKLLAKARAATGLAVITEVMSDRDVDLVAEYADIMPIGARHAELRAGSLSPRRSAAPRHRLRVPEPCCAITGLRRHQRLGRLAALIPNSAPSEQPGGFHECRIWCC